MLGFERKERDFELYLYREPLQRGQGRRDMISPLSLCQSPIRASCQQGAAVVQAKGNQR